MEVWFRSFSFLSKWVICRFQLLIFQGVVGVLLLLFLAQSWFRGEWDVSKTVVSFTIGLFFPSVSSFQVIIWQVSQIFAAIFPPPKRPLNNKAWLIETKTRPPPPFFKANMASYKNQPTIFNRKYIFDSFIFVGFFHCDVSDPACKCGKIQWFNLARLRSGVFERMKRCDSVLTG